ncbi:MAG: outer membrane lipoprotein chaperone LolA [Methylococcaceae bacterium]|nr:outer membrane lipoprotein chaperone LolA [Methylococcaceae bacterium]
MRFPLRAALLTLALSATATAAETPLDRLHAFLGKAGSLQADFSQSQVSETGIPGQRTSGVFYLQRPGKFRWDYLKPYHQEIVSNGGKVWFYDVDLEQVTTKKINEAIGSTPALLLSGEVALEQNFKVDDQGESEGLYWIRLVPKDPDSGFKQLLIGLDGENLSGMELTDNFGQLTRIYFNNVKTGIRHDPGRFEFKPPAGVDVFEEK